MSRKTTFFLLLLFLNSFVEILLMGGPRVILEAISLAAQDKEKDWISFSIRDR
jgi:hypothetical protein